MENVILQPIEVGGQTFKNRIMFPPLTTGYEKNGMISEQDMGFYTRLAKGGVGYIVLGDVAPINSFSPTPKLFDDSQIPALDVYKRQQGDTVGPISALFEAGMSNELFPLLLFIGIGAMIDFGPLLEKPWLMLFGAAAQFGIFFTLFLAGFFFDMKDAASIAVIGAADGPTAIFVANTLKSQYLGAIMVAAYSYMALVPIVQPPVIRLLTTQKERRIRMPYEKGNVTQLTKILFPVVVTVVAGLVAPASVALVGFLMLDVYKRQPWKGRCHPRWCRGSCRQRRCGRCV